MPSSQLAWGKFSPIASAQGMSSAFEWWSLPFDMDDADSVSISLNPLTETPCAMLVVPSATAKGNNGLPSGDGILYVAQTAGAAGNNTTVAHSAPSGAVPPSTPLTTGVPYGSPGGSPAATVPGTNPYSVSTAAITAAPWVGAMNEQMSLLANQSAAVWALVKAFVWGWGAVGSPVNSLNSQIAQAASTDLLVTQASANLVGGAATAAISGTATLETCGDLTSWAEFAAGPNDVASLALSTGNPGELHIARAGVRYGRIHWMPGIGSVGQIAGTISLKGGAR